MTPPRLYEAPILTLEGKQVGMSTMSYSFERCATPDSTASGPKLDVRWSCAIDYRLGVTGGRMVLEAQDTAGGDIILGMRDLKGDVGEPISITGTTTFPVEVAVRLREPHWHLVCSGRDWGIKCGKTSARGQTP
jgi:hypothetical protein